VHDGAEYPEFVPSTQGWNEFALQAKLANIAAVIAKVNADIVGLCEVENVNALNLLKQRLEAEGAHYPYAAIADTPHPSSTAPCLLSRLPLTGVRTHGTVKVDSYYSRNILEATMCCGSDSLVVFVTHWPSKLHPESSRLAVARILARRIAQLPPQCDYLLLGDFNADYNEAQLLFSSGHDDTQGEVGINHVLKTVLSSPCEGLRPVDKVTIAGSAGGRYHYDCWFELPPTKRGSYVYRGQWQTPDHVVLGKGLFDSSGWRYRENTFTVQSHGGALIKQGRPYRWQKLHRKEAVVYPGKGYSDHLPLSLTLERHRATLSAPPSLPPSDTGISFEQGMESWVGMHNGVWLSLDSTEAFEGRYSLRIKGRCGSSNATVARLVVPGCRLRGSERRVGFWVRGGGEWGGRIRPVGTAKWNNYFGPDFKPTSQARYRPIDFTQWTALDWPLPQGGERGFELEFRSAKNTALALWIDAVSIR
jgi:endonuclease/exonuclease/phosphatase family metal-dependent hydrolase